VGAAPTPMALSPGWPKRRRPSCRLTGNS
jgi:hypothetical protein